MGPSALAVIQPSHSTIGVLVNNAWSFAGQKDWLSVNQSLLQYLVNYNISNGWYMGTQPIITSQWKAGDDSLWPVPFGWSAGKIMRLGLPSCSWN